MKQYQAARLLRRQQTPAEACLWAALRGHRLGGLHSRRQHPLGGFIADFYCPSAKLAVEVDGAIHHTPQQAAYDRDRDVAFALMGVTVLRVSNEDVLHDTDRTLQRTVTPANPVLPGTPR
jgi:very-short-patch-repair endonuclease